MTIGSSGSGATSRESMSKQILLCDDEIHILRAAEFKFRRAGYEVLCASDGEEAWELIQQHLPDVVVTDCQMPRLNGLGLAERMRANAATADIPVIMLTGKGFELSSRDLKEHYGIRLLLGKPFSPRELFRHVEGVLGLADPPAAPAASSFPLL
jgi:two-component system, OmpR family, alkaline phosphatase synthesis response regulator PhoP